MINITDKDFEEKVLKEEKPVLVDFWAPWCGYCRRLAPLYDQIDKAYDTKIVTGKINIDEAPSLGERFEVMTIPTLLLFKGGKAGEALIAPESSKQIEDWLKQQGIE